MVDDEAAEGDRVPQQQDLDGLKQKGEISQATGWRMDGWMDG